MKRSIKIVAAVLAIAFIGAQFVPVKRTNRLGAGDPPAPRDVQWVLRRACYDCHSTESRWPIWAYVAPMSWLVVRDVDRARAVLNFSDWQAYPEAQRKVLQSVIGPVTATHRMPLWYYVTLHPDAKLSDEDRVLLAKWAKNAFGTPDSAHSTDR
jgi:hypothetical protein